MTIDPGKFDRRIFLMSRSYSADGVGGEVYSSSLEATVWAQVEEQGGVEKAAGRDLIAEKRLKVTIRYYSGFSGDWTIIHDGEGYDIVEAPVELGRRQYLQFVCRRTGEHANA